MRISFHLFDPGKAITLLYFLVASTILVSYHPLDVCKSLEHNDCINTKIELSL